MLKLVVLSLALQAADCVDCGSRNQAPPPAPQPFCTNQLNSGLLYSRDFPVPCTYFTMNPTVCAYYFAARSIINVTASAVSTQVKIIVTTPTASATTDVKQMLSYVFADTFAASSFFGITVTSAPTGTIVTVTPHIMKAGLSVPNAGAGSTLTLAITVGVGSMNEVTILVFRCRSRNAKNDIPVIRAGGATGGRLTDIIPCDDVPAAASSRGGLSGRGGRGRGGHGGRSSRNLFGSSRAQVGFGGSSKMSNERGVATSGIALEEDFDIVKAAPPVKDPNAEGNIDIVTRDTPAVPAFASAIFRENTLGPTKNKLLSSIPNGVAPRGAAKSFALNQITMQATLSSKTKPTPWNDLIEGLEPVREALKAMGKADDEGEQACTCSPGCRFPSPRVGTDADFVLLDGKEEEDNQEAAAGGEASKTTAVAHVVYRAADIAICFLCIWFVLRILCIAVLAISALWCIQWMSRTNASALPGSIPPASRSGAFAKRLARRRASRAAKRAAAAAEWRLINEALAASEFARSVDSGSPSVPCSPSSPSTRHATLLSRYVERLRALGSERLRKTHPFCRLRSYLRRPHRKMILR